MIHEVKILPEFFLAVARGEKAFEVRKKDRLYAVGDYLALNEFVPDEQADPYDYTLEKYRSMNGGYYTGNCMLCKITYILSDSRYCPEGMVILSIRKVFLDEECEQSKKRERWEHGNQWQVGRARTARRRFLHRNGR